MKELKGRRSVTFAALSVVLMGASIASAQTYSVLYNFGTFTGAPATPEEGIMTQGRNGNIYSTTDYGGTNNSGAVFELTPAGEIKVLYNFCSETNCTDGSVPKGGLTLGYDGNFYGVTYSGGMGNYPEGTIYRMTPSGVLTTLHNFETQNSNGMLPTSAPVLGSSSTLYGVSYSGGQYGRGLMYSITPSGTYKVLYEFGANSNDGSGPATPALGPDGNLYGTTSAGGIFPINGIVYRITPTGQETILHNFSGTDGSTPSSPLVLGSDGNFYGTTLNGGSTGFGVVFKISPAGVFQVLHDMNGTTDGAFLWAGPVQASDGNLYGVGSDGGITSVNCLDSTCGTLFEITRSGNFSVLYDFVGTTGFYPLTTPFQHTNGMIYGQTYNGGSGTYCANDQGRDLCGVVYQFDNKFSPFVKLMPFAGTVGRQIEILGQGFTSSTKVSFNGTPAATVKVASGTYLVATVPAAATTGYVTVTTSSGTLKSNVKFIVKP